MKDRSNNRSQNTGKCNINATQTKTQNTGNCNVNIAQQKHKIQGNCNANITHKTQIQGNCNANITQIQCNCNANITEPEIRGPSGLWVFRTASGHTNQNMEGLGHMYLSENMWHLVGQLKLPILLLETPCPSVGPSVRNVFYPHLTRTHTNLMSERAR